MYCLLSLGLKKFPFRIMKKIVLVFIAIFGLITSCEDDDFCNKPTTPRMILVFYDNESPEEKKSLPLSVWAENKDSIYKDIVTDSILIPLNTKSTSTKYILSSTNVLDTLDLNYTTLDIFTSEACGFINHFFDFGGESTTNWIKRVEFNVIKIKDETETHVAIYH